MSPPYPVVTIDGPAGAGKSTVAQRLARRLGYSYVNSGAIYRAVAWRAAQGAPLPAVLVGMRLEFRATLDGQRVLLDGRDVTDELHTVRVSELAATLSQRPEVRAYADALQRAHADRGPLVVEGRDAGTVVFPHAACKFYLDASIDARAERRRAEVDAARGELGLAAIRKAIQERDREDRTRTLAPLTRTPDAVYVDSSDMTADEVVDLMAEEVERACSTRS